MSAARGRVWKVGRPWHYEVRAGSRVVIADNANDWAIILHDCTRATAAVAVVLSHGHRLRSWSSLVEKAMER